LVRGVPLPHPPAFVALTTLLAVVLLVYVVSEPLRIRKRAWRALLWYPPVWVAIPLAWAFAAASEWLPAEIRPYTIGPQSAWQNLSTVAPIALAIVFALTIRQLPLRRSVTGLAPSNAADEPGLTWMEIEPWISEGERPVSSGERDLFQSHRIAARIAKGVSRDGRHVALLGRFGSGKSSILNLVKAELGQLPETFVVTDFDVWAVPNPEDVPRLALNRILSAFDDVVDTSQFRSLPLAYQRLAAAEPTGGLSTILGLEGAKDSLELLEELTKVLVAIGARLVLIVQDVERAGEGFDTRHLERLLWALRSANRVQFILSVDPDNARLDFSKLCDSIELVPPMQVDHVEKILRAAYGHWRTKFSDIDPHPRRQDADKLQLSEANAGRMMQYLRRTGRDTPLDALVSLLTTPRSLKHVLRRVDHVWNNLHGEAELDDVVIVTALRHAAEPVYRFLLADIDAARHEADRIFPRTTVIKEEWTSLLAAMPNGPAAQRLIDLMGIKQLVKNDIQSGVPSPQGVHESDPVDYFRRIVAEELSPTELRDQTMLRDIDEWKKARQGPLLERLLASTDADEEYARIWEHFSFRQTEAELMELVSQLVVRMKKRDGSAAAGDHRALIGLWRCCKDRLRRNEHAAWLQSLILDAIPASLHLATDLFHYWTGDHGIVDDDVRAEIRQSLVDRVRVNYRSGDDLAKALTSEHPYLIVRLITQTGADPSLKAFEAWSDYLPDLLIDGAQKNPELILPELANLVGDDQSGHVAAKGEYPPRFVSRYGIDRRRAMALFGSRVDDALSVLATYAGDNSYVTRTREAATSWLDERRVESGRAEGGASPSGPAS
jgi:hypothetical protein